jgi:hypothetical protein
MFGAPFSDAGLFGNRSASGKTFSPETVSVFDVLMIVTFIVTRSAAVVYLQLTVPHANVHVTVCVEAFHVLV